MRKITMLLGIMLAALLAQPAPGHAQPTSAALDWVDMHIYSNNFGIGLKDAPPDAVSYYRCPFTFQVSDAAGTVLAQFSDIQWRSEKWYFINDWSKKAPATAIVPGNIVKVWACTDDVPDLTVPPTAMVKVPDIKLTEINDGTDKVRGILNPKSAGQTMLCDGWQTRLNVEGGAEWLHTEAAVAADGTFTCDFHKTVPTAAVGQPEQTTDLIRNAGLWVYLRKGPFTIYDFEVVPGLSAMVGSPFALFGGRDVGEYRASLAKNNLVTKGISNGEPILNVSDNLFQFHSDRTPVPIRATDKIHLSLGGGGGSWWETVPDVSVTKNPAPVQAVAGGGDNEFLVKAMPNTQVCIVCVGCHRRRSRSSAAVGTGLVASHGRDRLYISEAVCDSDNTTNEDGELTIGTGAKGVIAIVQKGNGDFFMGQAGLEDPINKFLIGLPLQPWFFGDDSVGAVAAPGSCTDRH